jgi:hypothetical protein
MNGAPVRIRFENDKEEQATAKAKCGDSSTAAQNDKQDGQRMTSKDRQLRGQTTGILSHRRLGMTDGKERIRGGEVGSHSSR